MSAMGWGLLAFAVWVAMVMTACALMAAATRKPTPRSDFQQWEGDQ